MVAAMLASKLIRTLSTSARDWDYRTRDEEEAMARSNVDRKEAERKWSEVGGQHLFMAEVR
jgi:hypothetical protein